MRLLELFSGSKSVSKAVGSVYDEIISIDIIQKYNPTVCCDILNWNYKQFPPGYFDAIWASPPCCEYSCLNYTHPEKIRNLELADSLVQKAIEIIDYFQPEKWFIENPESGLLKDRDFMLGIPFYDVDYCQYSDWGYRKRTRIWTAVDFKPKLCNKDCPNKVGNRHKKALGNSEYKEYWERGTERQLQRYAIPPQLIKELFSI